MLILSAILVLLVTPLVMVLIRLSRPNFAYNWLVAVSGVLVAWPMLLLSRPTGPETISLSLWESLLPVQFPTALLIDSISWPFAFAVVTLSLAVILTAVARPGVRWHTWAGTLILAGLGCFATLAGNPFTLLAAWFVLDLAELVILFLQVPQNEIRERMISAFSARVGGIVLLIWAMITGYNQGQTLTFENLQPDTSLYLLLAASLRLGVLPMHLPFLRELPVRRGLGTMLRLVPVAATSVLLVRTAQVGVNSPISGYLLAFVGLAGLFGAWSWATARNELNGRSGWIIGVAALAVSSAILGQASAAMGWALAAILTGGLVFLSSNRQKTTIWITAFSILAFSTLPFTPTWNGIRLYAGPLNWVLITALPAQVMLLVGIFRHTLYAEQEPAVSERYVLLIYPLGLALLPLAHFLSTGLVLPTDLFTQARMPLEGWILGGLSLALAAGLWFYSGRIVNRKAEVETIWNHFFSLSWFYQFLWRFYQVVGRVLAWITTIFEGQGGVLWALVLLALLVSLFSQVDGQTAGQIEAGGILQP